MESYRRALTFVLCPPSRPQRARLLLSDNRRVYSDAEFALILRKATELAAPEESPGPASDGLTLAQITVCDATNCPADHQFQPTGSGVVNLVTVTVTGYTFTSMVPFVVPDIVFGPVSATMVQPI